MTQPLHDAPAQRPAGRSERIGNAVRECVLDLVITGGSDHLTFERVAERAGVSRSTLYRRWGNTSRLLTWVLLETMSDAAPVPDTGSFADDVRAMMANLAAVLTSPVGQVFARVALVEAPLDPAVAEAVQTFWRERIRLAGPVYGRAVERGELEPSIDFALATDLIYGPLFYRAMRGARIGEAELSMIIDSVLPSLTPHNGCDRARD